MAFPKTYNGMSINQVVERVQAEVATDAEEKFVCDRIKDLVKSLCVKRVNGHNELEDLEQKCFCKIWQSLDSFDTKQGFTTWVFYVCKSALNNQAKLDKRDVIVKDTIPLGAAILAKVSDEKWTDGISDLVHKVDLKLMIDEIFEKFPSKIDLLTRVFSPVDGKYRIPSKICYSEIAKGSGVPYNDVRNFVQKDLRNFVKGQMDEGNEE